MDIEFLTGGGGGPIGRTSIAAEAVGAPRLCPAAELVTINQIC